MDAQELLKKVRRIEIKTKGISKHLLSGEYHSAFKGKGMSFSEVRAYQFGDDVRNIDWNVTARTNDPFVKVFEEERELTVMLMIDISASSFFGSGAQNKRALITELAAVLSFSAIQNNDKVGVIFFSSQIERFIPPKKGKQHILMIIRELLNIQPVHKGTNIAVALEYFNNLVKKRSISFLISDFIAESFETPLRIAKKRHDVIGIHVYDKLEEKIPAVGLLPIRDPESGKKLWIDTNDKAFSQKYQALFKDRIEQTRQIFTKIGASWIDVQTEESYIKTLLEFFKKRAS
ncbi:MAG: DUF58 domain-containing protein [Saprospiraceae bacterium]|nr:DUF58 domain-containing protein [Saprospiraceae bacterium]